jgi:hypothetical protein
VADPGQFSRVGAGLAVGHLGDVIGQLGQGLGRPEADAGGQAGPLLDEVMRGLEPGVILRQDGLELPAAIVSVPYRQFRFLESLRVDRSVRDYRSGT